MIGLAVLLVPVGVLLAPRVLSQHPPMPENVIHTGFGDIEVLAVQRAHGAPAQPTRHDPGRPVAVATGAGPAGAQDVVGLQLELGGHGRSQVVSLADFSLVADGHRGVAPVGGSVDGADPKRHPRLDGSLRFRIPSGSRTLVLEVRDGSLVRRLALGPVATSAGTAPAPAL